MRVIFAVTLTAYLLWSLPARACGCFTMPSVSTPVVQAGERILFAHDGQNVIAYIQIQYSGSADQFGWLVPLPSVPTLQLGTDEMFTVLGNATQPQYQLTTTNQCSGASSTSSSSGGIGCGGDDTGESLASFDLGMPRAAADMGSMNPVVVQASVGPFDYAVLKADDQTEMQQWLMDNGYFVPDATGTAVAPYIHSGAFFLALKLRAGQSTGDIVPIILSYPSDLPMIPITLTSVGAVPNMGVMVWVLGTARAIPRNYHHTVLDDVPVWLGAPYQSIVTRAMQDAPGHHAFITEYAGGSSVMSGQLYYQGRFGDLKTLAAISDPSSYLSYLQQYNYTFDSTLFALLERFLPMPAQAITDGVSENEYYGQYDYYSQHYSLDFDGGAPPATFDAAGLTAALDMRIVEPTKTTQALFDGNPYLTRLYSTISPEDMNLDPVFSSNPDLPEVSLIHSATLTYPCSGDPWLATGDGFEVQYAGGLAPYYAALPATLRLETLREAGAAQVEVDDTATIKAQLGPVSHGSTRSSSSGGTFSKPGCECDFSPRARNQLGTGMFVVVAMALLRRRRRRA
jgi:Uncharacterized protein conserved in bacteria (DUF2330)